MYTEQWISAILQTSIFAQIRPVFPGSFTQISMSSKFMSGAVLERGAKPNSGSPKQWV